VAGLLGACGDGGGPERVWTGQITDAAGAPIAGAVVSVGDVWGTTGNDGGFRLRDVEPSVEHPWTATAPGYVAWSLATEDPGHLIARLQLRRAPSATPTATVRVTLRLDAATTAPRDLYISIGAGQVVPVPLQPGEATRIVDLALPLGVTRIAALAPSGSAGAARYAAPVELEVVSGGAAVTLTLQPTRPARLTVELIPASGPTPVPVDVAMVCTDAGAPHLAAVSVVQPAALGRPAEVELFGVGGESRCDLTASFEATVNTLGEARHVAFALDLDGGELAGGQLALRLPAVTPLRPRFDGPVVRWQPVPEATVYDLYLAPDLGAEAGPVVWSGTTALPSMTLPSLPQPARDALALDAGHPWLLRVIGRRVPGFDVEDRWDWSTYSGYIASPWAPVPDSALAGWR